jgi:YD repeat-containing protein
LTGETLRFSALALLAIALAIVPSASSAVQIGATGCSVEVQARNGNFVCTLTTAGGGLSLGGSPTITTGVSGGETATFRYDTFGRLVAAEYTYDSVSNLISINQGESDGRFTYDGHRRVTGVETTGETIEYEYDGGELVRRVQDGERTEYGYDRRGRLVRSAGPLGQIVDYVYDRDGSLLRASSTIGVTRFTYDRGGRLTAITGSDGGVTGFAYDGAGLLTSVVPAVGDEVVVSFEHGDLNAPVSVGFLWSEDGGDSFTVTPRGRLRTCSTCP